MKSITEMKNTSEMALNVSRVDIVEGKVSGLEGTAIETIPKTTCTIKRIQAKENNLSELWDYIKQHNTYKIGVPPK